MIHPPISPPHTHHVMYTIISKSNPQDLSLSLLLFTERISNQISIFRAKNVIHTYIHYSESSSSSSLLSINNPDLISIIASPPPHILHPPTHMMYTIISKSPRSLSVSAALYRKNFQIKSQSFAPKKKQSYTYIHISEFDTKKNCV